MPKRLLRASRFGRGLSGRAWRRQLRGKLTVLLKDSFTNSDSTALASHTMDIGSGWTVHAGTITINSNKARTSSAPGTAIVDVGCPNYTASITTNATSDAGGAGMQIRFTDTNNVWSFWLDYNASSFDMYEVEAGAAVARASTSYNPAAATDQVMVVVASGTSLTATINGANQISYNSATFNQYATRAGIRGFQTAAEAHDFDNFEVTV